LISKQWDKKFEIDLKKEAERILDKKIDVLIDLEAKNVSYSLKKYS
jgi:predicted O-linked N-acetylglucosamine transferase (SPINDLY family)